MDKGTGVVNGYQSLAFAETFWVGLAAQQKLQS
jgi:hypothetical protein